MSDFRFKTTQSTGACTCTLEPSEVRSTRFDLEAWLTKFLEDMPLITKDWLHYKM